jgi:quercetin dioxygenase-like cupin family protein
MKNQREGIALRLKGLREAVGQSIAEMAAATGTDAAVCAAYERGQRDVPLSYLSRLAARFHVDVTALLTGGDAHMHAFHVTRKGRAPVVARRRQYHYEALGAGFAGKAMEPYRVTVEPGTPVCENTHPGQEFDCVVRGRLLVRVAGHDVTLKAGDSIYFDATQPHGMQAVGGKPATFLAIITA